MASGLKRIGEAGKSATKVKNVKLVQEFKSFIMKGNVLDMAVGIIIGLAFGTVVTSMVNDLIMPPIGIAVGNMDFKDLFVVLKEGKTPGPYPSIVNATAAGAVTWRYGAFINTVINFLIVAFAVFMLVRMVGKMRAKEEIIKKEEAPTEKECPYCFMKIPIKAMKCGHCTSAIEETAEV
jgi:large conductance mechanosensitive channel